MSKYAPLSNRLKSLPGKEWRTTFGEIERLIGGGLPPVARKHRAWWSNNPVNSAITRAWLEAGFRTEQVSMAGETLVFRRIEPDASSSIGQTSRTSPRHCEKSSPIGGLQGTVRVKVGTDLTEPTEERWDAGEGRL